MILFVRASVVVWIQLFFRIRECVFRLIYGCLCMGVCFLCVRMSLYMRLCTSVFVFLFVFV